MSLCCRLVTSGYAYLNTASSASVVHFGDVYGKVTQKNRVIAVQRAIAFNVKDETRFANHALFYKPFLTPVSEPPASLTTECNGTVIRTGTVYVLGITASSVMRFGCSGPVTGESRIVNIRNFNNRVIR